MHAVFADPKTDFVFKRIFGVKERKGLLIALLNDLLELHGDYRISDLEYLPPEQHVAVPELKLSIVDVKCSDGRGRHFVVEMQLAKVEGMEKRIVYNASKAYVMQLKTADEYPALCDVVGVTICNFNLWPEPAAPGAPKVPMLSRWKMQEQHSGSVGLPQVQYVFLELPKYTAGDNPQTLVDKWVYFFREARQWDHIPPTLVEAPYRDALEVARAANFSPLEWEIYERAKMAEQDARGMISVARREGLEQGHQMGLQQGIQQGRQEGIQQGIQQGELKGQIHSLLKILRARGVEVDEQAKARIEQCDSEAVLDAWLGKALHIAKIEELWAAGA